MVESVFIGRKNELDILNKAFVEASEGKGKLVLIEGNAGIGKSGLTREFIRQLENKPDTITGIAECNDKENLNAYAPFKDILVELNSQALEQKGKQTKEDRLKKLKQFVSEAGSTWIGLIPIVGGIAESGIDTYKAYQSTYNKKQESNIESENDIYRIFENEFRRLAQEKTIVIFIDDLQWADASSLNLLFALGKTIRANPFKILLIGSYRNNEIKAGRNKISEIGETVNIRHPFADKLNELRNYLKKESHIVESNNWFQEITLVPFSHDEIYELINTRFLNNKFEPAFFENANHLTDGQPLYLVEILDYLLRNGIIEHNNGVYTAKDVKLDELPISVNAIISEKVERLDKELRKVLSYASVNGEEFAVQIVEKILKIDELDLLDYLEELSQKHGLLEPEDPAQIKDMLMELYSFSQTLVHKFIYENMDGARRRALHRRIATTIEEIYGDALETNKEIKDSYNLHKQIGQGLIDAVNLQVTKTATSEQPQPQDDVFIAAAVTEIQNAKESYEQFAMNECYDFVDKALAFLSKVDDSNSEKLVQKFNALLWRNSTRQWKGLYKAAKETAMEMEEIANQLSNDEFKVQSGLRIAISSSNMGDNEIAINYLSTVASLCIEINKPQLLWKVYYETGRAKNASGLYDEAIEYYERALKLAREFGDENKEAEVLRDLGRSYNNKSENDKAIEFYNKALQIFEKNNNKYQIGKVYNNIGLVLLAKANYKKSFDFFERSVKIATEQNDKVSMSNSINNQALVLQSEGDYDKAIEYYNKSLEIDKSLDDKPMIVTSLNNIGIVYATKGDFEHAVECMNESVDLVLTLNDKVKLSATYSSFGSVYLYSEDDEKAIDYYKKSLEIDLELGDKISLAVVYNNLGIAYRNKGDIELATEYYNKAKVLYNEVNDEFSIALVNNNLGGIAYNNKDYKSAIVYYEDSLKYNLKVDDKLNLSLVYGNLAPCYTNLKEYDKAVNYAEKAVSIAESLGEKMQLSGHYSKIALAFYYVRRFEESVSYLKKAILVNTELNKKNEIADNYRDIGDAYYELKNYKEAIVNYQKSIEMFISINGEDDDDVIRGYGSLGNSYYWDDQYDNALICYNSALAIQKRILGEEHEDVALTFMRIGNSYYWDKQYKLAVTSYRNAYNIRKKNIFGETKEADESRCWLAKACYFADYDDEAKELFLESLEFRNKIYGVDSDEYKEVSEFVEKLKKITGGGAPMGSASPNPSVDNNSIGEIDTFIKNADTYYQSENFEDALYNYQAALKLQIEQSGWEDNNVAGKVALCHDLLGTATYLEEEYESSIAHYLGSLKIYNKFFNGARNRQVAECYRFLGLSYYELEKFEKAISHWKAARELFIVISGNDSFDAEEMTDLIDSTIEDDLGGDSGVGEPAPQPINNQDSVDVDNVIENIKNYTKSGDAKYDDENYQDALKYYVPAYELTEKLKKSGERTDEIATINFKLGMTYKHLKNYKEAEGYFITALNDFVALYGNSHVNSARSYSYMGDIYYYLSDYPKAINNHNEALSSYLSINGSKDSMVAFSHYDLGLDYYWDEQYDLSIQHLNKALEIRVGLHGEEHSSVANCYHRLGLSYYWSKNYIKSVENFVVALKIREGLFGEESEDFDDTMFALGKSYYYADKDDLAKDCFISSLKFRNMKFGEGSAESKKAMEWLNKV